MKKGLALISMLCLLFIGLNDINAQESSDEEFRESLDAQMERLELEEETQQVYDMDGNPIELSKQTRFRSKASAVSDTRASSDYNAVYGIVDFYANRTSTQYISYTNEETGDGGYIGGNARDAAYLGRTNDGRIRFKMAGVVGVITKADTDKVAVYGDMRNLYTSFYRIDGNDFYHYTVTVNNYTNAYYKTRVGYRDDVSYLTVGKNYYSYDGHYFYEDEHAMVDDYNAKTYKNAVNANSPYYNYYQFLPLRSQTTFTAQQLDNYTAKKVGSERSAMIKLGNEYIAQGHAYGVNPLSIYATSALESGWGKSALSLNKNNLFGHAAYDSDAYNSATAYDSPSESLAYHAREFMSKRYLNPMSDVYFGGYLGDKNSGANVKYASDPWWGEKQAAILMEFAEAIGTGDYKKYSLGIKEEFGAANVRSEPSTKSGKVIYTTKRNSNMSFLILEKVTGEYVNGSNVWYRVQCDGNVNANRSGLDTAGGAYDFSNSYVYVHASNITRISGTPSEEPEKPEPPKYAKGDVNNDGKISSTDYVLVKNHILGQSKLNAIALAAADVNVDGKITSTDYVKIKNHILGISQIK